jgi:hypothetical protein
VGGRQRRGCYRSTREKRNTTADELDSFAVESLQDIPLDTTTFKLTKHGATPISESHLFAAARDLAMEHKFISRKIAIARQHASASMIDASQQRWVFYCCFVRAAARVPQR